MHGIRTEQEHRPGWNHVTAEVHRAHRAPGRDPRRGIEPQGFRNDQGRVREGAQVGGRV